MNSLSSIFPLDQLKGAESHVMAIGNLFDLTTALKVRPLGTKSLIQWADLLPTSAPVAHGTPNA